MALPNIPFPCFLVLGCNCQAKGKKYDESPGSSQRLYLFIKVLRVLCPNLPALINGYKRFLLPNASAVDNEPRAGTFMQKLVNIEPAPALVL